MRKGWRLASYAVLLVLAAGGTAAAQSRETYTYEVQHPQYGNIGTYTDTVAKDGDTKRIDTKMRIAVKLLGITMFREAGPRAPLPGLLGTV